MRGARPEAAVEQMIERDGVISRGDRVVVACSGGADSVALAAILANLRKPMELHLAFAYVHHGTRRSAWQDECVVLRIGATFGVPVRVVQLDGNNTDEGSLRNARYEALVRVGRDVTANVVATAHHQEDQSETVLMALLRGAGLDGLAGMRPRRSLSDGIDLARPLLHASAEELRHYCHVHALPYAVDPTNGNLELRRNAVRAAFDALRPLFPGLDAAMGRTAELVRAEIEGRGRAALRREVRSVLAREDALRDVDFEHVEAVVRTLERGGSGRFYMKPGLEVEVAAGIIAMRKEP